jgi:hypothetical protein
VSVLLELLRWWALATGVCSVLLVLVVVGRSVWDAAMRLAVRQQSRGRALQAVRGSA